MGADLHAFGIKLGVAFGYTCPGERAHQPAGRALIQTARSDRLRCHAELAEVVWAS